MQVTACHNEHLSFATFCLGSLIPRLCSSSSFNFCLVVGDYMKSAVNIMHVATMFSSQPWLLDLVKPEK